MNMARSLPVGMAATTTCTKTSFKRDDRKNLGRTPRFFYVAKGGMRFREDELANEKVGEINRRTEVE